VKSSLIFLLIAFSLPVFAESLKDRAIAETAKRMSLPVERVMEDHETGCASGITPSMAICAEYLWTLQDLNLNDLYSQLQLHLNTDSSKAKLKKAQLAWLKYRDSSCEYEADGYRNGTWGPIVSLGCMEKMSAERNKILKEYLACDGSGCPGDW
jgi:uncharacterized protein YecT (DUF1311 family)